MKHIVAEFLALIALACSLATTARAESFAKQVDIGGGRMMYIECHGSGSPTVLLISGTDTASDLWHAADQKGQTVAVMRAKRQPFIFSPKSIAWCGKAVRSRRLNVRAATPHARERHQLIKRAIDVPNIFECANDCAAIRRHSSCSKIEKKRSRV